MANDKMTQANSEFIDFVAHELKQPMTSMQGYARMLLMGIGGELSPMQKQFVQVINSNADRMGKLVNDLLEISRLEAGRTKLKPASLHLREVVGEVAGAACAEIKARQHSLHVHIPDDLPPVLGDRERLVQILSSLLNNACRYTPNGGKIWITAASQGRDRQEVPPAYLEVVVRDTGIGICPEDLVRLNPPQKFFRSDQPLVREQPGTGLGLAVAHGLIALHGGTLAIESEIGKGTACRFTLPLASC